MSPASYFQIYDEVYSRRETANDLSQLCNGNYISSFDSALDFGCGTGLYTRALIPHFKKVFGHDIDTGARTQFSINAKEADFVDDLKNVPAVNAVFSFFNVFNYLENESVLNQVVSHLAELLRTNGVLILDLLNAEMMNPGVMSKSREIQLNGEVYLYHQSMEVFPDRRMNFDEFIEYKKDKIYSKTNHLRLWNVEELKDVIGKYLQFKGLVESRYISNNQIRLCFKKEAK